MSPLTTGKGVAEDLFFSLPGPHGGGLGRKKYCFLYLHLCVVESNYHLWLLFFLYIQWFVYARTSCRTVALWFDILVTDHNATDSVMQKSCNLQRRIFCALWGTYFFTLRHWSIKYLLFLNSRHISLPTYIFYSILNPSWTSLQSHILNCSYVRTWFRGWQMLSSNAFFLFHGGHKCVCLSWVQRKWTPTKINNTDAVLWITTHQCEQNLQWANIFKIKIHSPFSAQNAMFIYILWYTFAFENCLVHWEAMCQVIDPLHVIQFMQKICPEHTGV
jgi:hypothetical protein